MYIYNANEIIHHAFNKVFDEPQLMKMIKVPSIPNTKQTTVTDQLFSNPLTYWSPVTNPQSPTQYDTVVNTSAVVQTKACSWITAAAAQCRGLALNKLWGSLLSSAWSGQGSPAAHCLASPGPMKQVGNPEIKVACGWLQPRLETGHAVAICMHPVCGPKYGVLLVGSMRLMKNWWEHEYEGWVDPVHEFFESGHHGGGCGWCHGEL